MGDISITVIPDQAAREARIRKLCQDHAWRFHRICPGSEARYVIEGYVRDATPADWDYAYAYVAATPELFTTMPQLYPDQVAERDAANSRRLQDEALDALNAGNPALAMAMLRDAEWWAPVLRLDAKLALCQRQIEARS